MYKVEKNIPKPTPTRNGVSQYKYPFFKMSVGSSFAVPVDPTTTLNYLKVSGRVSMAIRQQHERPANNGMKFSYRTDKVNRVIRVWRDK